MRSFFSVILLILFTISFTQAQDPFNPVNLISPDHSQLEFLTFESINDLRKEQRLSDLHWDDVLKRAAKDHADYLIKEKKISHYQTAKGKKTPAERVKIHGGLVYTIVGENIIEVPLGVYLPVKGVKRSTITYQSSANTMAQIWKASPGHYKNIISPQYNCTAIAVSYDSSKQRLIAVQVFGHSKTPGSRFDLPDHSSKLVELPEQLLPYKLRKYRYNAKNKKAVDRFQQLKLDRGYITGSFRAAKKIFRGRRSGISQEFIPLSQFDRTSNEFTAIPNRRNGLYELNGKLSKPVYRRTLLKYSRKYSDRDFIIYTPIFRIKERTKKFIYPLESNMKEWEFNLFLIQSKRLAAYRTYINVPGELFTDHFPQLNYVNSFKEAQTEKKFRVYHSYDTLRYKIFYSPNVINIHPEKQEEIQKSMLTKTGKIINVDASAYASIEGDKISNDKLASQRIMQFMQLIRPYKDSMTVTPKIKIREQWEVFYKQISGTPLQSLKKMKVEEIREYVNQHKEDSLLSTLLNEQRYMEFTMIWRNDHKEYLPAKTTLQVYDSLKSSISLVNKQDGRLINELEKAQLSLYYELSQKNKDSVVLPKILDLERYPVFKYHELIFRYKVLEDIDDKEFYEKLHELAKSKYFPGRLKSQAIYNNLVFIYQKYISGELEEFLDYGELGCYKFRHSEFHLKKFRNIKCKKRRTRNPDEYYILKEIPAMIGRGKGIKIKDFPENELWKYYYLYTIHSLYPFVPMHREINSLLPGIKKFHHPVDSVLRDEERLKLAYFYCCFSRYSTAKKLVEPLATRNAPDKAALKLYLTLSYDDYEDEHDYIEMLINEFPRLGKEEWCDLWFNPAYLNFLLLEDLKLKNFYNCNCGR